MNSIYDVPRIKNNEDASHCLQFAVIAAVKAVAGIDLDVHEAEEATGFQPGGTWPYAMLTWFASNDIEVVHIESMDLALFAKDPYAALRKQGLDEATISLFADVTDLELEQTRVQKVLADSRIKHVDRLPSAEDIRAGVKDGWLPLVSLDSSTLNGGSYGDFEGHMVLISAEHGGAFEVQDPGPPPHWNWRVPGGIIEAAMRVPVESSGSVTLIRKA